jgi:hypothetical protein
MRTLTLVICMLFTASIQASLLFEDDFSSLTDGELLFRGDWSAASGINVTSGEVSASSTWKRMVQKNDKVNNLAVGETVQIVIDARVEGTTSAGIGMLEFGVRDNVQNWNEGQFIGAHLRYDDFQDGTIKLYNDRAVTSSANNTAALGVAPTFAGLMLQDNDDADGTGTYPFDGVSDTLRMTLSLTKTATQDEFSSMVSLKNMDSGETVEPSGGASIINNAALYGDAELFFVAKFLGGATNGKNPLIDSVSVSVIPEPATVGMLSGMGGLMIWVRRRFMS